MIIFNPVYMYMSIINYCNNVPFVFCNIPEDNSFFKSSNDIHFKVIIVSQQIDFIWLYTDNTQLTLIRMS